jgi:hypothetical protein
MEQYAVVNYDDRVGDDNFIQINHITTNFDYANKLAFHYVKKTIPPKNIYCRTECKIYKDYCDENKSLCLGMRLLLNTEFVKLYVTIRVKNMTNMMLLRSGTMYGM